MLKLLLAVDGSEHSELTVRKVIDMAAKIPALTARLVNVQPQPLNWEFHHGVVEDDAVVREKQLGRRLLEEELGMLEAAGVPHEWSVEIGDPAEEIVRVASETSCDVIAIGSHGLGALASLVLGSVATRVVRMSRIPVLLLK